MDDPSSFVKSKPELNFSSNETTWLACSWGRQDGDLRGIDRKFSRQKIARTVEQIEVKASGALFEVRLHAVHDARVTCHRLRG